MVLEKTASIKSLSLRYSKSLDEQRIDDGKD